MDDFTILDVGRFPLVFMPSAKLRPGFAPEWQREMEILLRRTERFALIAPDRIQNESQQDRKARSLWIKANRSRLSASCAVIITVEPDPSKREFLQKQGEQLGSAIGVQMCVTENALQAELLALQALGRERADTESSANERRAP